MWPPMSSFRMSLAYSAAWSAPSANLTPPAFMRPPVRTWDLITVGPPMRWAISRASWSVVAKPKSVTGIPARLTISRASYSKKRMAARNPIPPLCAGGRQLVRLRELGVLAREHLGEVDHDLALLPGGVVLHLAVDHVYAAAVRDRLDHLLGELDLVRIGREDPLRDLDLRGVERPRTHAAEQERRPELRLAALGVLDVAVGAVEGEDPRAGTGVDHARDRVVPGVLLGGGARRVGVVRVRVLDHAVARVPAAHARRLHAPVRGEVRGPEAHALHARAGGGDLLGVRHPLGGLEDRVDQDRPLEPGPGLELREQAVHVVDVPGALDLGDHDHGEALADGGHEPSQGVQHPGALERVDAGPQLGLAELHLGAHADQAIAGRLLAVDRDGVLEVAQQDVHLGRDVGRLGDHLLVREVEEVDHPRGPDGDFPDRLRGADCERLEEVSRVSHSAPEST